MTRHTRITIADYGLCYRLLFDEKALRPDMIVGHVQLDKSGYDVEKVFTPGVEKSQNLLLAFKAAELALIAPTREEQEAVLLLQKQMMPYLS